MFQSADLDRHLPIHTKTSSTASKGMLYMYENTNHILPNTTHSVLNSEA